MTETPESRQTLEFKTYSLSSGFVRLLNEVTFSAETGDVMAVVGPVGSGKSVLMQVVSQALWDTWEKGRSGEQTGSATILGYSVSPKIPNRTIQSILAKEVVMVQSRSHWLPMPIHQNFSIMGEMLGIAKEECQFESLVQGFSLPPWTKLQLLELSDLLPSQISLPVLQQLAVIRALARKPKVLILDEAFIGMDPVLNRQTERMVLDHSENFTTLIATNDLHQASRLSNKILYLVRGFVEEFNHTYGFFTNPQTRSAELFIAGKEESF
jgi:ABC-type phosphate transport system ATPase subunit